MAKDNNIKFELSKFNETWKSNKYIRNGWIEVAEIAIKELK